MPETDREPTTEHELRGDRAILLRHVCEAAEMLGEMASAGPDGQIAERAYRHLVEAIRLVEPRYLPAPVAPTPPPSDPLRAAVDWVLTDMFYTAPEQAAEKMARWQERLGRAEGAKGVANA